MVPISSRFYYCDQASFTNQAMPGMLENPRLQQISDAFTNIINNNPQIREDLDYFLDDSENTTEWEISGGRGQIFASATDPNGATKVVLELSFDPFLQSLFNQQYERVHLQSHLIPVAQPVYPQAPVQPYAPPQQFPQYQEIQFVYQEIQVVPFQPVEEHLYAQPADQQVQAVPTNVQESRDQLRILQEEFDSIKRLPLEMQTAFLDDLDLRRRCLNENVLVLCQGTYVQGSIPMNNLSEARSLLTCRDEVQMLGWAIKKQVKPLKTPSELGPTNAKESEEELRRLQEEFALVRRQPLQNQSALLDRIEEKRKSFYIEIDDLLGQVPDEEERILDCMIALDQIEKDLAGYKRNLIL
jgi:hypothetical protein